jgi:hypothetical protein
MPTWRRPRPAFLTVSILLNCATARALAGEKDEAARLEAKARGIGMEGNRWYQGSFEPPQIRLALARHQLGKVAELAPPEFDWEWELVPTFLDALAALGHRERIEAEAPKWLQAGTFAEPFALRALGIACSDLVLLQQALVSCERGSFTWAAVREYLVG